MILITDGVTGQVTILGQVTIPDLVTTILITDGATGQVTILGQATIPGLVIMIPITDGGTGQVTILGQATIPGLVTIPDGVHLMMIMVWAIHQVLSYIHQCPMVDMQQMKMDIECQHDRGTA